MPDAYRPLHHPDAQAAMAAHRDGSRARTTTREPAYPAVQGRCPACHWQTLILADGGHVTCARLDCPDPCAADQLLHGEKPAPGTTTASTDRCRVCGTTQRLYWRGAGSRLPYCTDCEACDCRQAPCVRTGIYDPEVSETASLRQRAETAEERADDLAVNNAALLRCAERAGVRRDQLAGVLREVLAEFRVNTHPGEACLRTYNIPVARVQQWRAVLGQAQQQTTPTAAQARACDAYQPPTTAADTGLCARCGMYDYKHQEQPDA